MPKAERLSSKFHSCPRSFASGPTVHFSDNLSALDIILRYTSRRKARTIFQLRALSSDMPASRKGVYLFYNPPNNFSRRTHLDRSCIFCGFFFMCSSVRNCQPASYLSVFYLSVTRFFWKKPFSVFLDQFKFIL